MAAAKFAAWSFGEKNPRGVSRWALERAKLKK